MTIKIKINRAKLLAAKKQAEDQRTLVQASQTIKLSEEAKELAADESFVQMFERRSRELDELMREDGVPVDRLRESLFELADLLQKAPDAVMELPDEPIGILARAQRVVKGLEVAPPKKKATRKKKKDKTLPLEKPADMSKDEWEFIDL